jgi:hypothetical protein
MDICDECKAKIEEVVGEIAVFTIQAHPKCEACGKTGHCHSVDDCYVEEILDPRIRSDMLAAAYAIFESMQDAHNESQKTLTQLGLPPLTRQPGSLSQCYFDWIAAYETYLGRGQA